MLHATISFKKTTQQELSVYVIRHTSLDRKNLGILVSSDIQYI